mmetsp:Transcript_7164/g.11812  ORF Transcript_7164/g.11812 Transcript_7164/m.11812 type:complete len:197 (-) Transcript_7164:558-1148(-)
MLPRALVRRQPSLCPSLRRIGLTNQEEEEEEDSLVHAGGGVSDEVEILIQRSGVSRRSLLVAADESEVVEEGDTDAALLSAREKEEDISRSIVSELSANDLLLEDVKRYEELMANEGGHVRVGASPQGQSGVISDSALAFLVFIACAACVSLISLVATLYSLEIRPTKEKMFLDMESVLSTHQTHKPAPVIIVTSC